MLLGRAPDGRRIGIKRARRAGWIGARLVWVAGAIEVLKLVVETNPVHPFERDERVLVPHNRPCATRALQLVVGH